MWKRLYFIWNLSRYSYKNEKYLASTLYGSEITYDKVVDAESRL